MTPVDIHPVRLDVPKAEITQYARLLSETESARANRFRFPHLSMRFTVAHGALRQILAGYLGSGPRSVPLTLTASGRPQLDPMRNPANIQFSLSHSGDIAVIAVCIGFAVGVDVEHICLARPFCELANRYFTPAEAESVRFPHSATQKPSMIETDRAIAFYRIWTLKESWIKATGVGMAGIGGVETAYASDGRLHIIRWRTGDMTMERASAPAESRHFEPYPGYLACYTRLYSSQTVSTI